MDPVIVFPNTTYDARSRLTDSSDSGAGLTLIYTRASSAGVIVAPLIFIGIGVGCIFQPTLVALQAHSRLSRRAVIISNRNFFRCAGGAVGLVVSAAVLQATLRRSLPDGFKHLAENTYALPSDLVEPGPNLEGVLDAYMQASRAVFILQIPLIGLCLLGCVLIRDRGLQPMEDGGAEKMVAGDGTQESTSDDVEVGEMDMRNQVSEAQSAGPGHGMAEVSSCSKGQTEKCMSK